MTTNMSSTDAAEAISDGMNHLHQLASSSVIVDPAALRNLIDALETVRSGAVLSCHTIAESLIVEVQKLLSATDVPHAATELLKHLQACWGG
jgi:hypothetical protein